MDSIAEKYKRLIADVARCKKCNDLTSFDSKTKETIKLEQDMSRTHINLWSHWQGSLDAEIMLIGQDWGRLPEKDKMAAYVNHTIYPSLIGAGGIPESPTDIKLQKLFITAFNIDISKKDNRLFFTNSVLCYKTGRLSGKTLARWFKLCNENYIIRLIEIIRPKIIITLGVKAFNSLKYCGALSYKANGGTILPYFKSLVESVEPVTLTLLESDFDTAVFPVYHCGSYSQINRPYDMQIEDWKRIARYIK